MTFAPRVIVNVPWTHVCGSRCADGWISKGGFEADTTFVEPVAAGWLRDSDVLTIGAMVEVEDDMLLHSTVRSRQHSRAYVT